MGTGGNRHGDGRHRSQRNTSKSRSGYLLALGSYDSQNSEPPAPVIPPWLSEFAARSIFGGNPLVKIGVLILFLGLAFLLRFVAENTVVPIELRYAGVAAAGIGLLLRRLALAQERGQLRPDPPGRASASSI